MQHATIVVRAEWDEEAGVWVASSEDVAGLSLEADNLERLKDKVLGALHDLIELNGLRYETPDIPVHFMAEHLYRIRNPCQ
ncbi:DUF1902 domain-containing protein [Jiella sonneratiae]|uniref:DUF1902 domain-containing protein n=1 Tax=Jiella sonneratiae TaxID=2816856 RepID=A0ABS3IZF1_9HYPH|nr:DUF1902 domain-containing protein [Jiella sonneratiae]MBO0902806.1 DUF1902 domain-containing protein [Jiella sonneratiae]